MGLWDVILPIDELHHFSRWAHCTTNQRWFSLILLAAPRGSASTWCSWLVSVCLAKSPGGDPMVIRIYVGVKFLERYLVGGFKLTLTVLLLKWD